MKAGRKYTDFIKLEMGFERIIGAYLYGAQPVGETPDGQKKRPPQSFKFGQILAALAFACGNYIRKAQTAGDRRDFRQLLGEFTDMTRSSYILNRDQAADKKNSDGAQEDL